MTPSISCITSESATTFTTTRASRSAKPSRRRAALFSRPRSTFASLTNLALFGLLTGFTVVTAFVADIGVAPALMELATRNLPRPDRHPDEAGLG